MSERRGVSSNGPLPISTQDMLAYGLLTGRNEFTYQAQVAKFIPVLDREYLRDFYDKQRIEMEKHNKRAAATARNTRANSR